MNNIILDKSFKFSIDSIKLYKSLIIKNEYVLSKQLLRSATAIGANLREAQNSYSKKEFLSKVSISLKEANETLYWIELLYASEYIDKNEFDTFYSQCKELYAILTNIVKSTRVSLKS